MNGDSASEEGSLKNSKMLWEVFCVHLIFPREFLPIIHFCMFCCYGL